MALTKNKLITRLQMQMQISKHDARQAVERTLEIMKDTLAQGEELLVSGFGNFRCGKKGSVAGEILKPKKASCSGLARSWCLKHLVCYAHASIILSKSPVLRNLTLPHLILPLLTEHSIRYPPHICIFSLSSDNYRPWQVTNPSEKNFVFRSKLVLTYYRSNQLAPRTEIFVDFPRPRRFW